MRAHVIADNMRGDIDGKRADLAPWVHIAKASDSLRDALELCFELFDVATMVARQRAHDPGIAGRCGEIDAAAQEHRRSHGRQRQSISNLLG